MRIRYYVIVKGRAYWRPTARMRKAGFRLIALGLPGPAAWARAEEMNAAWDAARRGGETRPRPVVPGSLADVWGRYRAMGAWADKAPRTREEWEYVWTIVAPVFGDLPVAEVDAELVDTFYARMAGLGWSLHKRHKVIKVLRAMLNVAITILRLPGVNPSLIVTNAAPAGRSQTWTESEVEALSERAWQAGYHGLSALIRVAYDSQFQPVDVRLLTGAQRRVDAGGPYFDTARAKTGKRALGTMTPATVARLDAYIAGLGAPLHPKAPIFRNRSGAPYSKDTLSDDFRAVRAMAFPGDKRRLMDMRRSGNVEAAVGGALPQHLSAKQGNTIAQSNALFETYTPVQLAAVRQADAARSVGRRRLGTAKVSTASAGEYQPAPRKAADGGDN